MNLSLSIAHGALIVGLVLVAAVPFASPSVRADSPAACTETDFKVATPSLIAVECEETDVSGFVGTGHLYEWPSAPDAPPVADIEVSAYPGARKWLIVELKSPGGRTPPFSLQLGKNYKVVFLLHLPTELINAGATPTTFDLEMNNTVVMSPAIAVSSADQYEFVSHFAYIGGPDGLCTLQVEDFSGKTTLLKAHECKVRAPVDPTKISSPADLALVVQSPEYLGSFDLVLDGNKGTQELPTAVPNLFDIFNKPLKIDSKSKLMPEKAPAGKDASNYYVNFNYGAGRGSKPGWILDGKVAPVIGKLFHGYQFTPVALADVGLNQVSDLKYTDTINFGASLAHMYQPNNFLQGLLFKPGITYETDREFDRQNLLASPDFQFMFVNLYNPRERRSAVEYSRELKIAEKKKIPWTRANSRPVLLGYALDFHTGFEIGDALKDTAVKASTGTAKLALPSYHIARVVPQVHGLFEVGQFSIDAVGTARYLTTVENTVLERPDHSLFLKRLHGWNAFGVISGSWNFDPAGHLALTLAYKNGFSPPRFSRVNTVQSGITLKY